jgi:hypothetical protein
MGSDPKNFLLIQSLDFYWGHIMLSQPSRAVGPGAITATA